MTSVKETVLLKVYFERNHFWEYSMNFWPILICFSFDTNYFNWGYDVKSTILNQILLIRLISLGLNYHQFVNKPWFCKLDLWLKNFICLKKRLLYKLFNASEIVFFESWEIRMNSLAVKHFSSFINLIVSHVY